MNNEFIKHLYFVVKLLRPRQWIKNFAIFAAIIFGGLLFEGEIFQRVALGFIVFCMLSSSTYIINDVLDVKKDKLHPFKRVRPIASGKVGITEALIIFVILMLTSLFIAQGLSYGFFLLCILYLIMQMAYSFVFKSVVIFDIFFIAIGYILRVYSGDLISGYHMSAWLILTTICLSLFLAIGKRRSELTLLTSYKGAKIEEIRQSLSHYSEPLLSAYAVIFAAATFIFYSLFTFLENPTGIRITLDILMPDFLPYYLQRKWLMLTIIPVIYGLMRYMQDIYEKNEGESPERVLQSDKALLASVIVWGFLTIFIIYFIR